VHREYCATILVHSTSLGCTLPIFLIAVGTVLAAGSVGSLALVVAYSLGRGVVLTDGGAGGGALLARREHDPAPRVLSVQLGW
jgi:cytochrome c biogenesis protein CcdA